MRRLKVFGLVALIGVVSVLGWAKFSLWEACSSVKYPLFEGFATVQKTTCSAMPFGNLVVRTISPGGIMSDIETARKVVVTQDYYFWQAKNVYEIE